MLRQLTPVFVLTCTLQSVLWGVGSQSQAKDLTAVLGKGLDFFIPPDESGVPVGAAIAPSFAGAIAQAISQEVPLASVSPAFTYRYNSAVDIFERSTAVPGPLFSERALTLGDKQFNVGVGYSFVEFNELNGQDLDDLRSPAVQLEFSPDDSQPYTTLPPGFSPLKPDQALFSTPFSLGMGRIRLKLQTHAFVPTLRYGLTENWDVGLVIPLLYTFLQVKYQRVPVADAPGYRYVYLGDKDATPLDPYSLVDPSGNFVPDIQVPFVKSQLKPKTARATGHETGVGDITLRSKYRFWRREEGGAALGLILQLPTGEKRNFHGTGETHLSTFLYLSQVLWGRMEPHLNMGVDFNVGDVDHSSFLYTAGATFLVGKKIGLIVDFIGRSEFAKFPVHFPQEAIHVGNLLNKPAETCTAAQPCTLVPDPVKPGQPKQVSFPFFPEAIKRNDIINFSFGIRYALGESGSLFFGGIVPLNNDGFRADFIPSGGIEYTF